MSKNNKSAAAELLKAQLEKGESFDFEVQYSASVLQLLQSLNISIALTSYHSQRLILLRSSNAGVNVDYTHFPRPMGLAVRGKQMILGTHTEILKFQREDTLVPKMKLPLTRIEDDNTAPKITKEHKDKREELLEGKKLGELGLSDEQFDKLQEQQNAWLEYQERLYEPVDEDVDACFIARSSHHSGMINIHDIAWGKGGLWAVNSSFSCLCTISPDFSFVPRWKPFFIDKLVCEDLCHLNGMAMKDDEPAYVTTFAKCNTQLEWRNSKDTKTGTLMCVKSNRILLDKLDLPHSPRYYNGKVYFCESNVGLVCSYDPETGKRETIAELPGFTRGMTFFGPLMFVGLSRSRMPRSGRASPLEEKYLETFCGVWIFNLENHSEIGKVIFTGDVDQLYDIAILEDCCYPELIGPGHPRMRNHFCYPSLND